MNLCRSPLRFPGGKQRLVRQISTQFDEYREPFVGGGSVFLWLKQQNLQVRRWWINDLFEPVFLFWQQTRDYPANMTYVVNKAKEEGLIDGGFVMRKKLLSNYPTFNDLGKAAAYFVLNRTSFSGLGFSGGYSELAFKERFGVTHISQLERVSSVLGATEITNKDYRVVMNQPGQNVFMFLDPPYDITSNNLYGNKGNMHNRFNHEEFASCCKQSPHKWLVTYNDNPEVRSLFAFANTHEQPVSYSMNSTAKRVTELIITNY